MNNAVAKWRARISEWLVRSSRAFLLGLVIACAIEVLIDWNATLTEINVLRNAIRQKGENYVGILGKASDDELAARDKAGLERLTSGIFDDEDAIYVRFTDASGQLVWDKLKADFAEAFAQRGNVQPFIQQYAPLMDRDVKRALHDPQGLKSHVANSRYKDFAQTWTDATARVLSAFILPAPSNPSRGVVVYEDRLHDDQHQKDDRVSYAIGTVLAEDGRDIGTVIVAFDMQRTNDAVRFKYIKFGGLCSFFVALILVQSTLSRRIKLRLLDLGTKHAAAKQALRDAMPEENVCCGGLVACGAIEQARGRLDGVLWSAADEGTSLLAVAIDPDGDGVEAAAVSLYVVQTFLRRRGDLPKPTFEDELSALGRAANGIPLTRPLGILLLRVDSRTGTYRALCGNFAQLRIVGGGTVEALELRPSEAGVPEGILGPLFDVRGVLDPGRSLVAVCADNSKIDSQTLSDGVARYLARTHEHGKTIPVWDAATWARGRTATDSDIAIVAVSREEQG
jgi:hypothetical protein